MSKGKKCFNMPSVLAQSRLWISMPRADWARSAGLTISEINIAIRELKEKCGFIKIRKMRLTPAHPVTLWISLDEVRMNHLFDYLDDYALNSGNLIDYHNPEPILKGIGYEAGVVDDDDA